MAYKAGTVQIDIKADTAKLVSGMQKAEKTVKNSVGAIKKTVLGLAAAYASIQSVNAFKNMVTDAIDAADATGKLAEKFGIATDSLSKLQYAAGYADVSVEKLNAGLSAMIRRTTNFVRSGGGAAAKALNELGISAEFARKEFTDTETTFKIIADRLGKLPDGFRKTAIAQDIFSKSAADVIRLANMGADEINRLGKEAEQFGVSVPQWAAQMAAAYNDTMTHIKAKVEGVKKTIAYGMLPAIKASAETIDKWFVQAFGKGESAAKKMGEVAVRAFANVISSAGFLKDVIVGIEIVLKGVEIGFWYVVKGIVKAFNFANRAANSALEMYNSLPDWMRGGDKVDLIPLRDESAVDAKIDAASAKIKTLTLHLEDGRKAAEELNIELSKNYESATDLKSYKYNLPKAPALFDAEVVKTDQKELKDSAKETAKAIYDEFKGLNRQLTNNFESFFDYASDGFMRFGELVENILHDIYMQMLRTQIINPAVSALSNILPFANGGVVQAYASGGIVDSPTMFPTSNGYGLMGEAGAEAIMPLTRVGGDLGVKATPSNVIINVKNETGLPVDMEKLGESMSDDGTRIIDVVMRHAQTNPEFRAVMGIK